MGTKTNQHTFKVFLFLAGLFAISNHSYGTELIELNRVVAKVNERIVTWGEIEKAMTMLNFTDQEKKERANEFVDGKVDRLLSIDAFAEKGMKVQYDQCLILREDFMMFTDKKYGDQKPSRSYGGPNYYGGYSDHLPIYSRFKK